MREEFFLAEKGMGVFLNERKVRVSSRRYLDEALVGTGLERGLDGPEMARMEALIPRVAQLRTIRAYLCSRAWVLCAISSLRQSSKKELSWGSQEPSCWI